jgi:arginine/lysine/ornithine decarboxylase
MKPIHLPRLFYTVTFTAALAIFSSGCATPEMHSFNDDFNQHFTTAPKYHIKDMDDTRFKVIVEQGKSSRGAERVIESKRACSTVAETEARRRNWPSWDVNYIFERDQGWMHIVKAEVTRKDAVEFQGNPQPSKP